MQGYFISVTKKDQYDDSDSEQPLAYVYPLKYCIDPDDQYVSGRGGIWMPSQFETRNDCVILKRYPGYHLMFSKLFNVYFEKFCQSKEVSCDGWMETNTYSPYKITRFKNDKMFLLLAMDLQTKPVNVSKETLEKVLQGYRIIYK